MGTHLVDMLTEDVTEIVAREFGSSNSVTLKMRTTRRVRPSHKFFVKLDELKQAKEK